MLVVLHLLSLFLLVLLGFYIFVADPRKRANQTFAAFISFLALWTTKDLVFWNFYDSDIGAGWWVASSFVIALLMQFALVVFAWVFPENARTPRRQAAILFSPGIILIPAALFGFLWNDLEISDNSFSISLTPLAYFYVAYVYFVFFFGAITLFRKYKKYAGTQKSSQLGAILWGLAITGILKTIANIALPFTGNYSLLPFSAIFAIPGAVIYAYAISNFRLFSFQTALDQFRLFPITYKIALSIASIAMVSFVVMQVPITWWAFRNGMNAEAWRRYLVFSVVSALVPNLLLLLIVVRIISRPLQKITLAAVEVMKGAYGATVDLRKSNDELGVLADSFNEMSRKMGEDIKRLKRMNEHLMRADRLAAMGTLAAGVAHEVNNPLASISSLIQMIRTKQGLDAETLDHLDLISSQITRISNVTKGLTDFARSRPAAKKPVNVALAIESALTLARYDSLFGRLQVEVKQPHDLPEIIADSDQLQQLFLNLLLNARDAMPDGGKISISLDSNEDSVRVRISDTGRGVDAETARKAFDPFFTTKPPGKGTGLGLAICYGIVAAHNGTIEIEPGNGIGTTFLIILPAAAKN